jgi:hypothetical protein
LGPKMDPLLSSLMQQAELNMTPTIGAEELANISSYQTLSADKNSKIY